MIVLKIMVHLVVQYSRKSHVTIEAQKRVHLRLERFGCKMGSTKHKHRMIGNDFNPASVILCHNSIDVVAYLGISVLLKLKLAECTEIGPVQMASYRRESRVRR
jgi:hypothetical protein